MDKLGDYYIQLDVKHIIPNHPVGISSNIDILVTLEELEQINCEQWLRSLYKCKSLTQLKAFFPFIVHFNQNIYFIICYALTPKKIEGNLPLYYILELYKSLHLYKPLQEVIYTMTTICSEHTKYCNFVTIFQNLSFIHVIIIVLLLLIKFISWSENYPKYYKYKLSKS